jgi:protein-S-isoprenylcysteine O-methyltransferase Ste14
VIEQEVSAMSSSRSGTAIRSRRVVTPAVAQPDRWASHLVRNGLVAGLLVVQVLLLALTLVPVGPVLWTGPGAVAWFLVLSGLTVGGLGLVALGMDTRFGLSPAAGGRLHRNGIYQFVRHPMSLGLGLVAMGATAASARLLGLVALVLLSVSLVAGASVEDRLLQRTFGWEFALYARGVPAIVPRPWRRRHPRAVGRARRARAAEGTQAQPVQMF